MIEHTKVSNTFVDYGDGVDNDGDILLRHSTSDKLLKEISSYKIPKKGDTKPGHTSRKRRNRGRRNNKDRRAGYKAVALRNFWCDSPLHAGGWFFKAGQAYLIKEESGIKAVYGGGKPIVLVDSSVYIDNFKLIYK